MLKGAAKETLREAEELDERFKKEEKEYKEKEREKEKRVKQLLDPEGAIAEEEA